MSVKKNDVILACTATALLALSPVSEAVAAKTPPAPPKRPNFVTIVIDDMGFSDLGYFGGEVPTPNLDQLASSGIILTNFYAASTSTPSRGMLFTGKDSHQVGLGDMGGFMAIRGDKILSSQPNYKGTLSEDVPTFAEVLQNAGYQTMMTGKWDMSEEPGGYAHDRGFEVTNGLLLPGSDIHYLSDADGHNITTRKNLKELGRTTPYNENGQEITTFPANAYSTEYYTDCAISMLQKRDSNRPFYLNVAYIAVHTPWQAPADIVAKYLTTYAKGWDVLRAERFERMKANGFFPPNAVLPPRPNDLRAWDSLTREEQAEQASRVSVYAAMIEVLDNNIGRLVGQLKASGDFDNTVFIVYSDNGAETFGAHLNSEPDRTQFIADYNVADPRDGFTPTAEFTNMGGPKWVTQGNEEWAMLANTPYNKHKVTLFEGGMHTMFFMHYPQAKVSGVKYDCMQSVMDIAPTLIEMGDATYPDKWNNKSLSPLQGISMAGLFNGNFSCDSNRVLAWEFDGMKGVRQGGWGLSQNRYDEKWYLFDLEKDPYERTDLASQFPTKLNEMLGYYQQYVKDNGVFEVSGRWLEPLDSSLHDGYQGFYAGVAVNENKRAGTFPFWKNNVEAKITDHVDISAFIRVAKEHADKLGNFYIHGRFTPADGNKPIFYALTESGLYIQESQEDLPDYSNKDVTLPTSVSFSIYEGALGVSGTPFTVPGTSSVIIGYTVDGGKTKVNTSEPLTFTVSAL